MVHGRAAPEFEGDTDDEDRVVPLTDEEANQGLAYGHLRWPVCAGTCTVLAAPRSGCRCWSVRIRAHTKLIVSYALSARVVRDELRVNAD
jgi:hypothetical protein